MARSVTYAVLLVRVPGRDAVQRYVLGEVQKVFANDVFVGSSQLNDVIIDDHRDSWRAARPLFDGR